MEKNQKVESAADTWFQVLRSAHRTNDRTLKNLARRELTKLGFRVTAIKGSTKQEAAQ
jgi:hypothetical protein